MNVMLNHCKTDECVQDVLCDRSANAFLDEYRVSNITHNNDNVSRIYKTDVDNIYCGILPDNRVVTFAKHGYYSETNKFLLDARVHTIFTNNTMFCGITLQNRIIFWGTKEKKYNPYTICNPVHIFTRPCAFIGVEQTMPLNIYVWNNSYSPICLQGLQSFTPFGYIDICRQTTKKYQCIVNSDTGSIAHKMQINEKEDQSKYAFMELLTTDTKRCMELITISICKFLLMHLTECPSEG